ncbi:MULTISPECIES: SRPBCC family protein [Asticcacaulis]|uniref:SRPBCC family protein n=1 Tax=Asticcacaulis TaxID=76890 RepID=UPI001AE218D4|nr:MULTISPECIES: SRPBCC family protein [Asticcacaulis]MBP2159997.1 uncharacterized protein YndB with AHSA1/START domain [Asticcacaulis solisilvae]MDR6801042.1 uncharacterized protein YndB with AHSA1/START domain [Asticcacaulis sp. BE141]
MTDTPDAIIKTIQLKASQDRVWCAITDSSEFGQWFGCRFDGPFIAGQAMAGRMTPTVVNDEIAEMQKPYDGHPFNIVIDRIEPQTVFAFRWHPYAVDEGKDYSGEAETLVTFLLMPADGGTHLTITESGFHQLPPERRAQAFASNEGGWEAQIHMVEAWLAR